MSVIGIDLGTTYSAAAISDDGVSARIIPNEEGVNITPSVVFFPDTDENEEPLVGSMAKNSAATSPYNVVQFIKRQMGNPNYIYTSPNGTDFHPEEISALILKKIKQYSTLHLGEEITDAVITVPAYFDDARRTATKQAGEIAGLNVLQVFNEPTAAAIAYGLNNSNNSGKVLVYDLGGGTYDITLMSINNGSFDVIATDGDPNLGGFDFDNKLRELIIADLAKQGYIVDDYDDVLQSEIREKAESAKRALTTVEQSTIIFTIKGKTYRVKITRDQFEEATRYLLNRTQERLELLLEENDASWQSIDQLLMIGGSTRMPMVKNMLQMISGKTLKHEMNPDEAVALGAAIYAKTLYSETKSTGGKSDSPISISDVTSQSLGVITLDSDTKKEINSIIISRNTKIPSKQFDTFYTTSDNQTSLDVKVTEGNDTDPEFVNIIARQRLSIPPYPRDSPIRVTFAYDIDQTIFVEVFDATAGKSLGTFDIDRASNLSKDQVVTLKSKVDSIPTGLDT